MYKIENKIIKNIVRKDTQKHPKSRTMEIWWSPEKKEKADIFTFKRKHPNATQPATISGSLLIPITIVALTNSCWVGGFTNHYFNPVKV